MLDIVVYEDNIKFLQKDVNCINLALADFDVDYRIHKCDSYNEKIDSLIKKSEGRKIYILGEEVNEISGLEIASRIREYDWDSIIIITSNIDKCNDEMFSSRLMLLDFVSRNDEYENRLVDDIKLAISIIDKQRVFTFKYNYVIYRIPYNQICYIEKEPDVKRCIIHTINNQYYITGSIKSILSLLNDDFCRTHQSCIVNLNNIRRIDLSSNMIIFKNGDKTDMLTAKMKKEVKKHVGI